MDFLIIVLFIVHPEIFIPTELFNERIYDSISIKTHSFASHSYFYTEYTSIEEV